MQPWRRAQAARLSRRSPLCIAQPHFVTPERSSGAAHRYAPHTNRPRFTQPPRPPAWAQRGRAAHQAHGLRRVGRRGGGQQQRERGHRRPHAAAEHGRVHAQCLVQAPAVAARLERRVERHWRPGARRLRRTGRGRAAGDARVWGAAAWGRQGMRARRAARRAARHAGAASARRDRMLWCIRMCHHACRA